MNCRRPPPRWSSLGNRSGQAGRPQGGQSQDDPTREAAPGRAPVLPRTAAVTPAQARKAAARIGPRPDGQRPAQDPYSPSSFPGGKPTPPQPSHRLRSRRLRIAGAAAPAQTTGTALPLNPFPTHCPQWEETPWQNPRLSSSAFFTGACTDSAPAARALR